MSEYMIKLSANDNQRRYSGVATIVTTYPEGTTTVQPDGTVVVTLPIRREVFTESGESVAVFWADNPGAWCKAHGFSSVVYKKG